MKLTYTHGLGLVKTTLEAQNFFFMVNHLADSNIIMDAQAGRDLMEACNFANPFLEVQSNEDAKIFITITGLHAYTVYFNDDNSHVSLKTHSDDEYMFKRKFAKYREQLNSPQIIALDTANLIGDATDSYKLQYATLLTQKELEDVQAEVYGRMAEGAPLAEEMTFLEDLTNSEIIATMTLSWNSYSGRYTEDSDAVGYGVDKLEFRHNGLFLGNKLIYNYVTWTGKNDLDMFTKATKHRVIGLINLVGDTKDA